MILRSPRKISKKIPKIPLKFQKYFSSKTKEKRTIEISLENILDENFILGYYREYLSRLKTTLLCSPSKNIGIYAVQKINAGEIIAYYKITAYNVNNYKNPYQGKYAFQIYKETGEPNTELIGDLTPESLPLPTLKNNSNTYIPFWGYFANEPSPGETLNAYVYLNLEENYHQRNYPYANFVYSIIAQNAIFPGEEILISYGDEYHLRNYDIEISSLYA